jgi:macrolide-specific efflux system membrane fusion protein
MRRFFALAILAAALAVLPEFVVRGAPPGSPLHVDSVVVTLIDQVDLAAREAGALEQIAVHEGQTVENGALLARLDDSDAVLSLNKAKLEREIAAKQAGDDVKLRFAKKALEVATAEEQRAIESAQKFSKSVSQTELDELRLTKQKAALEVEAAVEDQDIARLTAKLKENAVETAMNNVAHRHIVSPLGGMVVQIKRQRGEWVQLGEAVVRVVRLDRLRAEAFINAHEIGGDLVGRPVTLSVDLPGAARSQFHGKIVFVNPESNPVNGQSRVWAEIENPQQILRPGLSGSMTIEEQPAAKN